MTRYPATLLTLAFTALLLLGPYAHASEIFSELSLNDAIAKTKDTDRILLVDVMAQWCVPCKVMDAQVWPDPTLQKWVADNALAIQIDGDQNRQAVAQLDVRAYPTLIIFRNGEPFDRNEGTLDTDQLLDWLKAAHAGRTLLDQLRLDAQPDAQGNLDIAKNIALIQTLLQKNQPQPATDLILRLWNKLPEQNPLAARARLPLFGPMIGFIHQNAPDAAEPFIQKFNTLDTAVAENTATPAQRDEWATVAVILNKTDLIVQRTTNFIQNNPDKNDQLIAAAWQIPVFLLTERTHWAQAGSLVPPPDQAATDALQDLNLLQTGIPHYLSVPDSMRDQFLAQNTEYWLAENALYYAALLAANRDEHAQTFAKTLADTQPSPHQLHAAFVESALTANQPRPIHQTWLQNAADSNTPAPDLQAQLNTALNPAAPN